MLDLEELKSRVEHVEVKIPTKEEVVTLEVGDLALDCFGNYRKIMRIFARGTDYRGKDYVCFNTEFGPTSQISHSYKEDQLCRTLALTNICTSYECDELERELLKVKS